MVLINEWLPNPAGSDVAGEWVELWNSGGFAADLTGWRLTTDGKKIFTLHGAIGPGGYAIIPRDQSKLTLRNTDGGLALYDPQGRLADHLSFHGSAPEGESANREGAHRGEATIFFGAPTPGKENSAVQNVLIKHNTNHPFGVPLGSGLPAPLYFAGFMLGTAVALAAAIVFILRADENISNAFFRRN